MVNYEGEIKMDGDWKPTNYFRWAYAVPKCPEDSLQQAWTRENSETGKSETVWCRLPIWPGLDFVEDQKAKTRAFETGDRQ